MSNVFGTLVEKVAIVSSVATPSLSEYVFGICFPFSRKWEIIEDTEGKVKVVTTRRLQTAAANEVDLYSSILNFLVHREETSGRVEDHPLLELYCN